MALQLGVLARNAQLDNMNTQLGATATIKIFTGAVPVNCAAADPAGGLVAIALTNPVFATAASGAIAKSAGAWSANATAAETALSYRMYDSSAVCQQQGNVSTDLVLNNTSIAIGQTVTVTTYAITAGNA